MKSSIGSPNRRSRDSIEYSHLNSFDIEISDGENSNNELARSYSVQPSGWISQDMRNKVLAWLSMILAVLSGSSIGPMFKYMDTHGIQPMQSASWRCQCMAVWLIPFALLEMLTTSPENKPAWFEKKPELQFPVYIHVIIAGAAWAANLLTWIVGLKYTTTVRAAIFCNIHPLVLVFVLYFSGGRVSRLEWVGVFVSVFGVCVSAADGIKEIVYGHEGNEAAKKALFGDLLCTFAGINEVFIILNRHRIKPYVPLMQYTLITTLIVALSASVFSCLFEIGPRVFCVDSNCIFGWASKQWVVFMLVFGLYIGLVCMTGFNYAMQYLSPLVFSSVSLIDPALTGVISWISGLEGVPDSPTWIGGAVVISGIGAITLGEHSRIRSSPNSNNISETNSENHMLDTPDLHNSVESSSLE